MKITFTKYRLPYISQMLADFKREVDNEQKCKVDLISVIRT